MEEQRFQVKPTFSVHVVVEKHCRFGAVRKLVVTVGFGPTGWFVKHCQKQITGIPNDAQLFALGVGVVSFKLKKHLQL